MYTQQKQKEEKEAKRATLDSRHQFLFSTVATKLCIPENEVEDFILEGTQVNYIETVNILMLVFNLSCPIFVQLNLIDNFLAQNGSKCLLFYCEEKRAPGEG